MEHWKCITTSDRYGLKALWHEKGSGWPNGQTQSHAKYGIVVATGEALAPRQIGSVKVELNRRSVNLVGDVGIAFFDRHARATMVDGTPFEIEERCTHTWILNNGNWKILAAMSAEIIND